MKKHITDKKLATIDAKKNVRRALAEQGINFETGKKFDTVAERLESLKNILKRSIDLKITAIDDEMEDNEEKEIPVLEKIEISKLKNVSEPLVQKYTIKKENISDKEVNHKSKKRIIKPLMIIGAFAIGTLTISGVAHASSNIGEKLYYEHVKKEKMAPYKEMLDHVVLSSSHPMYKTRDVGNGEHETFCEYWLDYSKIAEAIKESDNPDLAFYTLYHYFGKTNDAMYEGITTRTCKYFEFSNENGELKKGDLYDFASSFDKGNKTEEEILKEYDEICDTELKYDFDSVLDNLEYKIVKPKNESLTLKKTRI